MNDYTQTFFEEPDRRYSTSIIKTISYSQDEILGWIIRLYCPDGFDLDPTYSTGNFYKKIPQPRLKFDIKPKSSDVRYADCRDLPIESESINTIIFDPPFVAAIPKREANGIITSRFGYYANIQHKLWGMYHDALREFYRILKDDGVLVIKCQDAIDAGKQYLSHVEIINCALILGFYPIDLFILLAKNRIIGRHHWDQKHARKFHSYFVIFIKKQCPVQYSNIQDVIS